MNAAPLAVAAGAAVGAGVRWGIGETLAAEADTFPWGTLGMNLLGCFLIGLAAVHLRRDTRAWDAVVTGGLGGFTTMSTFGQELNDLADAGRTGVMITYLVVTVVGGMAALVLGIRGERDATDAPDEEIGEVSA